MRVAASSDSIRTLMSSCAASDFFVSSITAGVSPALPIRTTGESECARPLRNCFCLAVSIAAKRKGSLAAALSHSEWSGLRKHQADNDPAVLQPPFRRVVVADRLACVASFDGDARRIDSVTADEVILDRLRPADVEVCVRSGRFAIVGVADDDGRRSRLLLHAQR